MPTPTHYTSNEGGLWKEWMPRMAGVTMSEEELAQRDPKNVWIQGEVVHSLAFSNPMQNKPFKRWDCVNGMNDANRQYNTQEKGRFA